jgi:hypothetical protein
MRFVDEILEQYFSRLEPRLPAYARRYWDHLNERGAMPQPKTYGIGDTDAQQVRIKLAQLT